MFRQEESGLASEPSCKICSAAQRPVLDAARGYDPTLGAALENGLNLGPEGKVSILAAAEALANGFSDDDLLSQFADAPWGFTTATLARLAWMREHQRLLSTGNSNGPSRPYECRVGPVRGRITVDREFATLVLFLLANADIGRRLRYAAYLGRRGIPDFRIRNEADSREFGLEVTEVESVRGINRVRSERECLASRFVEIIETCGHDLCGVRLMFWNWGSAQDLESIKAALCNQLLEFKSSNVTYAHIESSSSQFEGSAAKWDGPLAVTLEPADTVEGFSRERDAAETALEQLTHKAQTYTESDQRLERLPYVAAVYLNAPVAGVDEPVTAKYLLELIREAANPVLPEVWSEIWLLSSQRFSRLVRIGE